MKPTHDELRDTISDLVLGRLDGERRDALEAHLGTCPACRAEVKSLMTLAEPLGALDPERFLAPGTPAPASLDALIEKALAAEAVREAGERDPAPRPGTVDDAVSVIRTRRRARWWAPVAAGAVAGAAAVALAVAVLPGDEPVAGPPVIAIQDVSTKAGVTASAGLVDHSWGVELQLRMVGLPPDRAYDVRILDDAGIEHDSGAFLGVAGRTITCSMNSSVLLAEASRFEVVDPDGAVVISGPIAS